jgi:GT2 family glycosyltransferase
MLAAIMSTNPVRLSIIVPAYNNPNDLQACLAALAASSGPESEIIVVDDGSTDEIRSVATTMGITVLRLPKNLGPSSARNHGARHSTGDVLLFVDSDIVVAPGAVNSLLQVLERDPSVAAVFGSYDNRPRAKGVVSQYRNLLHHYVHQTGNTEASTFWGGFGAIRRSVFESVGEFDEKRFARCMEDIELGYRLRRAGHRIVLHKATQVTHLKRWTLRSVIRTDVRCRAIPWTRLILEQNQAPDDLNLKAGQRVSVVLVALACILLAASLVFAPFRFPALELAASAILVVIALNRALYGFFVRQRGLLFTFAAIPLHLLYFVYSGLAYLWVWCDYRLRNVALLEPLFRGTRF